MAVYATQADITAAIGASRLLAIADQDSDGDVETTAVERALSEASSLADSYLVAYLPITTVPDVLRRAVVDIAIHRLRLPSDSTTEDSRRAYDAALAWLVDVSRGIASLGVAEEAVTSVAAPVMTAATRVWGRSTAGECF